MKASLNWLNEYVEIKDININELANKLTDAGIEVENVYPLALGTNLVVGKVLDCQVHPSSDHLHICQVDVGNEILQIVCGAPNVATGQKVIVALNGAKLPAKGITIAKTTIRGVESNGMICSLLELGVDEKLLSQESIEGIEVLGDSAIVGDKDPLKFLGLDDVVFEIKLTPNRGDCLAIYSLAKEIGGIYNRKVKPLIIPKLTSAISKMNCESLTPLCPSFNILPILGVKVKPSNSKIKHYLQSCGIRSINNVVDIGNYVMLLTGQPLHMYDIDKLKNTNFVVKDDFEGSFIALDEKTYEIKKGDIVITNDDEIACLAGVLGSYSTMIDESTTNIAIEAAYFDSASIRKTASRLNLYSDSSTRFIKGIDKGRIHQSLTLAALLLQEENSFVSILKTASYDVLDYKITPINLSLHNVNKILGYNFTLNEVEDVFKALDFKYEVKEDGLIVTPPSYRNDITIERDLIEEIIRIKGFDLLPLSIPSMSIEGSLSDAQHKKDSIRQHLTSLGLNHVITYTLDEPKYVKDFNVFNQDEPEKLLNPLGVERSMLRTSLIPHLLHTVYYNQARNLNDVSIFEISNIYTKTSSYERLGIALSGSLNHVSLYKTRKSDFYTLKGLVEGILSLLGIEQPRYNFERVEKDNPFYHSGKSVYLVSNRKIIGVLGQIHPSIEEKYGVEDTYVAEIDLASVLMMKSSHIKYTPLNLYPPIKRDIAIVVDEKVEVANIIKVIKKVGKTLITAVDVFDVYQGEHIEKGYKSIALSLVYQDKTKTLIDKEVNEINDKVIKALEVEIKAKLRT